MVSQHAVLWAKMMKYKSTIMISHQFHAIQRNFSLDIVDISHNRDPSGPWDGNTHGDSQTDRCRPVGWGREIADTRSMSLRLCAARPGCSAFPQEDG